MAGCACPQSLYAICEPGIYQVSRSFGWKKATLVNIHTACANYGRQETCRKRHGSPIVAMWRPRETLESGFYAPIGRVPQYHHLLKPSLASAHQDSAFGAHIMTFSAQRLARLALVAAMRESGRRFGSQAGQPDLATPDRRRPQSSRFLPGGHLRCSAVFVHEI